MALNTILLAHGDAARLQQLTLLLHDRGYEVVGAVRTAAAALAVAASTPASVAIISEKLAGKRTGRALAAALQSTWGLPCEIVDEAAAATVVP